MEKNNEKKVPPKKTGMLKQLFGKREAADIFEEEQIQGPWKTVMRTFFSNKVSVVSLLVFLIIASLMFIYPLFRPVVLSDEETTQQDMAPSRSFMKLPDDQYQSISQGRSFGVGLTTSGDIKLWGNTRIGKLDLADVPEEIKEQDLVEVSVGLDHILALDSEGRVHAWGNNRLRQTAIPRDIAELTGIKQIVAGMQLNAIVTQDDEVKVWGNISSFDFRGNHDEQGNIAKIGVSNDTVFAMTKDGKIVHMGRAKDTAGTRPPAQDNFIDLAGTAKSFAGITEDGQVISWGTRTHRGEGNVPEEIEGKPVGITAGRYHYNLLMEDGTVQGFGYNNLRQATVPSRVGSVEKVFSGYYQNYGIKEDGKVVTWGHKGYLMGTDEFGRDLWTRLMNGGRMTLTIGAVAVLLSTVIGVVIGGVSGYFGGRIDMFLQRVSEMVSSLPFLPFAMILNALLGSSLGPTQRIYLMMIVLGLLSWTGLQRLVRAQVLSLREQEFVVAARSVGVKEGEIVFRHIIPNVISVIIVNTTLSFASSMLTESSLSFLGFGVRPPIPTWGNMLHGANNSIIIQNYWWRWVFPSIALSLTVIAVNLIGDGLRDAIDPRSQDR